MNYKKITCLFVILFSGSLVLAKGSTQSLAISQGVSSPTTTSTINFSNGFTSENPVGVAYQTNFRLTAQAASGNGSDSFGAELGIGTGKYGFALGYYDNNCTDCSVSGALAGVFGGVGVGLRFEEDISTVGLIFGANDTNRIGLVVGIFDPTGNDNNITSLGLGYSYVGGEVTFSIDASKRIFEDKAITDDTSLVTPGVAVAINRISISLSYDILVNEPAGTTTTNDLWVGVGVDGGSDWNMAFYSDYVSDFAFAGSLYF